MKSRIAMSLLLALGTARAGVAIDDRFWESYRPYQQYSREALRDLIALGEGDLLETAREIDGLELRLIGRESAGSPLLSARVVIDSVARERLQVKVIPFSLSPGQNRNLISRRRALTPDQADRLVSLLEEVEFWDAPYRIDDADVSSSTSRDCATGAAWLIEAYRPGTYQLVARSECSGLDASISEIRRFLLELAGVTLTEGN